jgi:hypothetical protein
VPVRIFWFKLLFYCILKVLNCNQVVITFTIFCVVLFNSFCDYYIIYYTMLIFAWKVLDQIIKSKSIHLWITNTTTTLKNLGLGINENIRCAMLFSLFWNLKFSLYIFSLLKDSQLAGCCLLGLLHFLPSSTKFTPFESAENSRVGKDLILDLEKFLLIF